MSFLKKIFVFLVLFSPALSMAAIGDDLKLQVTFGSLKKDMPLAQVTLSSYIAEMYKYGIYLAGILSVAIIMFAGFQVVMSAGNAPKLNDAYSKIKSALLGLTLAVSGYALLKFINPVLIENKDISLHTVNLQLGSLEYDGGKEEAGKYTQPQLTSHGTVQPRNSNVGQAEISKINGYSDVIKTACGQTNFTDCEAWTKAVMGTESSGNMLGKSCAKNGTCVYGLMQVSDDEINIYCSKNDCSQDPRKDPAANIKAGVATLSNLYNKSACNNSTSNAVCSSQDMQFVLAGYNGGAGSNRPSNPNNNGCPGQTVWQCERNGGYAETRAYIPRTYANYNKFK